MGVVSNESLHSIHMIFNGIVTYPTSLAEIRRFNWQSIDAKDCHRGYGSLCYSQNYNANVANQFTLPLAEVSGGKRKILEALQHQCTEVADLRHDVSTKSGRHDEYPLFTRRILTLNCPEIWKISILPLIWNCTWALLIFPKPGAQSPRCPKRLSQVLGTKPLSELFQFWLNPYEHMSVKFGSIYNNFHEKYWIWKYCLQTVIVLSQPQCVL